MGKKTMREAKVRLYDSTPTPYYLELDLDSDFQGPIGTPRQEEILVLNRGVVDALAHYIKGDDMPIMAGLPVSLKVFAHTGQQFINLLNWLAAMNDGAATQVNAHTIQTTKGDTQRVSGTANPAFADSNKICCNIEYLIEMGGTDLGFKLAEVWIQASEQRLAESEAEIGLPLSGKCFGTITRITAFTAGTDVEA